MSKLQAWREVRSKWATANLAIRDLELEVMNFRLRYPERGLPDGTNSLPLAIRSLIRDMQEVGYLTQEIRDDIIAEEGL